MPSWAGVRASDIQKEGRHAARWSPAPESHLVPLVSSSAGPKKAGVGLENPVGFPVQGIDSIQLTLGTSPTPPPVTQKTQWKSVEQWEVAAGKQVVATRKLRRGSGYYCPVFSLSMQSLHAVQLIPTCFVPESCCP